MEKRYVPAVEAAKMMRVALRQAFPGIKFSVKCRGDAVDIGWQDGPNSAQVEALVKRWEGGYFDGMIDYAGSRYALLDGAPVMFMSKYVFYRREVSDAMVARAIEAVAAKWGGHDAVSVAAYRKGALGMVMPQDRAWSDHGCYESMIRRDLGKRSQMLAQPSPEAERVQFLGDDGYGAGTVGMPGGSGGNGAYKAQQELRERARAGEQAPVGRVIGEAVIEVDSPLGRAMIAERRARADDFPLQILVPAPARVQ